MTTDKGFVRYKLELLPRTDGFLVGMRPPKDEANHLRFVDVLHNIAVLTYEQGRMVQSLIYGISALTNVGNADLAQGKFDFASTEMADLITQCRLLCERMDWDYSELSRMGLERYIGRMQELKAGKI